MNIFAVAHTLFMILGCYFGEFGGQAKKLEDIKKPQSSQLQGLYHPA
jgi:hypothetical protein